MQIRKGGVWRAIASGQIYFNGAWRSLVNGKEYKGAAWRDIFNFTSSGGGSVSISITPSPFAGHGRDLAVLTSPTITATPTGGLAPYTYSWSISSITGPGTASVDSLTTASTTVTASFTDYGTIVVTLQCVCTDSLGTVSATASVNGALVNLEPPPIGGTQ